MCFAWNTSACAYSLLPPGEQQAVVEQMEVHGLGGQLELGPRHGHHLGVNLQQLSVFHKPAGLRDQREDLRAESTSGAQVTGGKLEEAKDVGIKPSSAHFSLKIDLLVEVNQFLHPLHGLHAGVAFFDDLGDARQRGYYRRAAPAAALHPSGY